MKRFAVLLSTVFLVVVVASGARATTIDIFEEYSGSASWSHSYEACCGLEGKYHILGATLTIVADDVDAPGINITTGDELPGEEDWVYVGYDETGYLLGQLSFSDLRTPLQEGNTDDQAGDRNDSTTSFSVPLELLAQYSGELPVYVDIDKTPGNWTVEIETSSLDVQCSPVPEPATMILLGSGLLGIVPFRKKFGKK